MTIPPFNIYDINGRELQLGSYIRAYAKEYDRKRVESYGTPVYELDTTRPRPFKGVPLFTGWIDWHEDDLSVWIQIEVILVDWENKPSRVRMDTVHHHYELIS